MSNNLVEKLQEDKMFSEFLEISPSKAKSILEMQPQNRRPIRSKVLAYSQLMLAGRWQENHPQGLIFNAEGELINGQHRLLAVIESGRTIKFFCTFNASNDAKILLDTNTPRRIDQTGKILGMQTTSTAIAITRALYYQIGNIKSLRPQIPAEILLEKFKENEAAITFAAQRTAKNSIVAAPIRVVLARAYLSHDHEKLLSFIKTLDSGFDEGDANTAIALRNMYLNASTKKINAAAFKLDLFQKSIFAVHSFLKGEKPKTLKNATQQYFLLKNEEI